MPERFTIGPYDPWAQSEGYTYDAERAEFHVEFTEKCLTHVEGKLSGKPFMLEEWQKNVFRTLFGWYGPDGYRRYREFFLYVPRKNGKALDVDTPIPTLRGWKRMGDIRPGDMLFDEWGDLCCCTNAFETMVNHRCYSVEFMDGSEIIADEDHLWTVYEKGRSVTIRTAALAGLVNIACTPGINPRVVTKVEEVESRPVRCIAVNSPSRLFLAGKGEVPTHNTPMSAGIACNVIFLDDEKGQQNYLGASDTEQAKLLFRQIVGMIDNCEPMQERVSVYKTMKSIERTDDNSYTRVISGDAKGKHGGNPHLVLIDELHEQPNRELVDTLTTSMASENRAQSLIGYLTTADYARPSICNEKLKYAVSVCENGGDRNKNGYDPRFLPILYMADTKADWTSKEVWAAANPNLGVSVSMEYMENACQKAIEEPSYENTFKRLHLNMMTEQAERWLQMNRWDECDASPAPANGRVARVGLDLSSTTDITAIACLHYDSEGDCYDIRCHYFIPEDRALRKEKQDKVPYRAWAKQGWVTLIPGEVIDYDWVIKWIEDNAREMGIETIAVDPWNASQISNELQNRGFEVVQVLQRYKYMSEPSKDLERRIMAKKIRHGGDPVLRWMAANCALDRDPRDNIMPSKGKSTERIDGIVAVVIALALALASDEGQTLEEHGVDFF